MARVNVDGESEEVTAMVRHYGSNRWCSNEGKLECMQEEIDNVRGILGRFLNAIADKKVFTDEELLMIIRGH